MTSRGIKDYLTALLMKNLIQNCVKSLKDDSLAKNPDL
jgi:hypothetical protein